RRSERLSLAGRLRSATTSQTMLPVSTRPGCRAPMSEPAGGEGGEKMDGSAGPGSSQSIDSRSIISPISSGLNRPGRGGAAGAGAGGGGTDALATGGGGGTAGAEMGGAAATGGAGFAGAGGRGRAGLSSSPRSIWSMSPAGFLRAAGGGGADGTDGATGA